MQFEGNDFLRISISSEQISIKEEILSKAYADVKQIFIDKFISGNIINEERIVEYLDEDECIEEIIEEDDSCEVGGWLL